MSDIRVVLIVGPQTKQNNCQEDGANAEMAYYTLDDPTTWMQLAGTR